MLVFCCPSFCVCRITKPLDCSHGNAPLANMSASPFDEEVITLVAKRSKNAGLDPSRKLYIACDALLDF